jgi:hypothetical protein
LHRFRESDVFRYIFERVVAACMAAGLVKSEGFAVDASVLAANASRYHGKAPDEIEWAEPERRTRAIKEYLAALEAENESNPDRKPLKVISPSNPCSAWTAKTNKRVQFGYGLNYLIDIENAVIIDVEATPARTYDEVAATKATIERTDKRLGAWQHYRRYDPRWITSLIRSDMIFGKHSRMPKILKYGAVIRHSVARFSTSALAIGTPINSAARTWPA